MCVTLALWRSWRSAPQDRSYAGMCARRRSSFFAPPKTEPKKADPTGRVPALRSGQPAVLRSMGGAAELTLFTAFTPFKHPQRVRSQSKGILQCPCPPIALRSSARPEGEGAMTRAIASLGPGLTRAFASLGLGPNLRHCFARHLASFVPPALLGLLAFFAFEVIDGVLRYGTFFLRPDKVQIVTVLLRTRVVYGSVVAVFDGSYV